VQLQVKTNITAYKSHRQSIALHSRVIDKGMHNNGNVACLRVLYSINQAVYNDRGLKKSSVDSAIGSDLRFPRADSARAVQAWLQWWSYGSPIHRDPTE
jgi:hypothetical protein